MYTQARRSGECVNELCGPPVGCSWPALLYAIPGGDDDDDDGEHHSTSTNLIPATTLFMFPVARFSWSLYLSVSPAVVFLHQAAEFAWYETLVRKVPFQCRACPKSLDRLCVPSTCRWARRYEPRTVLRHSNGRNGALPFVLPNLFSSSLNYQTHFTIFSLTKYRVQYHLRRVHKAEKAYLYTTLKQAYAYLQVCYRFTANRRTYLSTICSAIYRFQNWKTSVNKKVAHERHIIGGRTRVRLHNVNIRYDRTCTATFWCGNISYRTATQKWTFWYKSKKTRNKGRSEQSTPCIRSFATLTLVLLCGTFGNCGCAAHLVMSERNKKYQGKLIRKHNSDKLEFKDEDHTTLLRHLATFWCCCLW